MDPEVVKPRPGVGIFENMLYNQELTKCFFVKKSSCIKRLVDAMVLVCTEERVREKKIHQP